jgi:hypothetical protein
VGYHVELLVAGVVRARHRVVQNGRLATLTLPYRTQLRAIAELGIVAVHRCILWLALSYLTGVESIAVVAVVAQKTIRSVHQHAARDTHRRLAAGYLALIRRLLANQRSPGHCHAGMIHLVASVLSIARICRLAIGILGARALFIFADAARAYA